MPTFATENCDFWELLFLETLDLSVASKQMQTCQRTTSPYEIKIQESLIVLQEIDKEPTDELQGANNELWKAAEISFQLISQQLEQSKIS